MTSMDATAQYMTGQMRPSFPALLADYQRESDAVALSARDVQYGPHPRQAFDFVQSPLPWRGTLAYFHAGFWQSRDKALFRFIAPALAAEGIDVALVNYPLCPDVTLPALVDAARAAIPAVLTHAAALGRGGACLIAAGHSAGGHLAVELALTDWGGVSPIRAVAALSGVYDLEPLLATPLNDNLRLDHATARAMSPVHRARPGRPRALFAVGSTETPAFRAQNEAMHAAWTQAGNPSVCLVVEGADHFSLLRDLQRPSALLSGISALIG
jgi:arylformamidase